MLEALRLDLKFAARSLGKRPEFALLGLLTLALGIGVVTSVFSVVNGVLLRPLAYSNPERIVILWHDLGNGAQSLPALHPKDLFDYRERSELFEEWTLATGNELILGGEDDPELVDVGRRSRSRGEISSRLLGRGDGEAPPGAMSASGTSSSWEKWRSR